MHGSGMPRSDIPLGCRGSCARGGAYGGGSYVCSRYKYAYASHGVIQRCAVGTIPDTTFDAVWRACGGVCPTGNNTAACPTCPAHKPYYRKKTTQRSSSPLEQYFCTCCKQANTTDGSNCPAGGTCTDYEWSKDCTNNYDCGAGGGFECVDNKCVECDTSYPHDWASGAISSHTNFKTCGTCPPHAPFYRYDDHSDTGWPQFSGCVPCAIPKNAGTSYGWYYYPFNHDVPPYKSDDNLPGCRGMCGGYTFGRPNISGGDQWGCIQRVSGVYEWRCPIGMVSNPTTGWTECNTVCPTTGTTICNTCPEHRPYYRIRPNGEYACSPCHTVGLGNGCNLDVECNENFECSAGGLGEIPDLCDFDSDCGEGFKCTGSPRYCAECSNVSPCGSCNCGIAQKPDGMGSCVNSNSCCDGPCNVAVGKNSCNYTDLACSGVQQCQTAGDNPGYCCGSLTPYWRDGACKPCSGTSGHTGTCNTPGKMCNDEYNCVPCTASDEGCVECYINSHCSGIRQCQPNNLCCPAGQPYLSGSTCVECLENRHCSSNICQSGECKSSSTVVCGEGEIWHQGICKSCPIGATKVTATSCDCGTQTWYAFNNTCVDYVERNKVETSSGGSVDLRLKNPESSSSSRYNSIKSRMNRIKDKLEGGIGGGEN